MHEYKITPIFKGGHICVHLRFLKTKNATLVKMAHQKNISHHKSLPTSLLVTLTMSAHARP